MGDKKNNHRIYSVVLDNGPAQYYNGTSGCGGAFGKTCEQQEPAMKYLASNLNDSLHNVIIVNHPGVNASFFGISYFLIFVYSLLINGLLIFRLGQYCGHRSIGICISLMTTAVPNATNSAGTNIGVVSSTFPKMLNFFLLALTVFFLIRLNQHL